MPALRDVLIAVHAFGAVTAFASGVWAILPAVGEVARRRSFWVFTGGLGVMIVFIAGAIATDWPKLQTPQRVTFSALFALALFMGYRARLAGKRLREDGSDERRSYIDHVGFDLISLFVGFAVVAAIDLHAPIWLVLAIAAGAVLLGRLGIQRLELRALG